jgi:hypothetical protein
MTNETTQPAQLMTRVTDALRRGSGVARPHEAHDDADTRTAAAIAAARRFWDGRGRGAAPRDRRRR